MPPNFDLKFKRGDLVYIPQDTVFLKKAPGSSFYRTNKPSIGIVINPLFAEDKHIDDVYDVYIIEASEVFMATRGDIYNLIGNLKGEKKNVNSANASNQGAQ